MMNGKADRHCIAIYGATGAQGGVIARSLLQNPARFSVRAITRNPSSEKAKELARLGAEVIKADGYDHDSMEKALQGAWGFWLNTDHQDPSFKSPNAMTDTEFQCRMIALASANGVKVLINSTTIDPSQFVGKGASVHGMEEKNKVFSFACSTNCKFDHVIGVMPGYYMENFFSPEYVACFGGFPTQPDGEGYLTFASPQWGGDGKVPFIALADDFGDMVHGMFLNPAPYDRKILQCYSDAVTFDDVVRDFQKSSGKKSRFIPYPTPEAFPTHGVDLLVELQDIFRFTQQNNGQFFGAPNDIGNGLKLKQTAMAARGAPEQDTLTLRDFLERNFVRSC